jgi:hypothetical protein
VPRPGPRRRRQEHRALEDSLKMARMGRNETETEELTMERAKGRRIIRALPASKVAEVEFEGEHEIEDEGGQRGYPP